jgi:tRNA(Ile)-lysidine synthase
LLQQVRRTIERGALLPPGARVLVALSGGSDSVALALALSDLAEGGRFSVAGVAHLNHQLRASAGRDEAACRALAARLNLPCIIEQLDVRRYAASQRLSVEDAARRLRYDFLARAAATVAADRIAVGHTEDDQAETFLLKLVRGAGPTGLGGIYPRKGAVVRPLLDISRAELREYLTDRGIGWVEDESNADIANPRNRLRHVVIPELDRTTGGAVRGALARAAELSREDSAWLDELSSCRYTDLSVRTPSGIEIDAASLAAEPPPIVRRVLLLALRAISGGREVGLEHVRSAAQVLAGACGGTDVPGGRVELRRGKLVLSGQGSSWK